MNMQILDAQVLIDVNGTRVGDITPLPTLTTPFVSTPNQTASNYWPVHVTGPIKFLMSPAQSDLIMENFTNNITSGGGTGGTTFYEPMLRGQWANTAWLGSPSVPFWQVRTNELWVQGNQITSSDARFKQNITNHEKALNKVMQIRSVIYDKIVINENTPEEKRIVINERNKNEHGFIAQELMQVYPELAVQDQNGYYGVKYEEMIAILVKAMQELPIAIGKAQIDSLKQIVGE